METSFTESDSEESGRELPSSAAAEEEEEEEEKTENGGYSHEENGNSNSNDDDGDGDDGTTTMSRSFVVGGGRTSKSASVFSLAFPISRVRKLVKSDGDIQWVGVEAGFLIAKAAELFLEKFVEDAFDRMQESHRNSITYSDLSSHVVSTERLEFLSGQWYHCIELHWNSFFYPFWNPLQNPFPHPHYGAWTSFLVFHLSCHLLNRVSHIY